MMLYLCNGIVEWTFVHIRNRNHGLEVMYLEPLSLSARYDV